CPSSRRSCVIRSWARAMVWCIALASGPALGGCSALSQHDDVLPFVAAPWDEKPTPPARAMLGTPTIMGTAHSSGTSSFAEVTTQSTSFGEAMTRTHEPDKESPKEQIKEPTKKEPAKEPAKDEKESEDDEPEQKPAIKVRGRINADAVIVNQSTRNRQI